jgi:hypothetical protein
MQARESGVRPLAQRYHDRIGWQGPCMHDNIAQGRFVFVKHAFHSGRPSRQAFVPLHPCEPRAQRFDLDLYAVAARRDQVRRGDAFYRNHFYLRYIPI